MNWNWNALAADEVEFVENCVMCGNVRVELEPSRHSILSKYHQDSVMCECKWAGIVCVERFYFEGFYETIETFRKSQECATTRVILLTRLNEKIWELREAMENRELEVGHESSTL